MRDVEKLLQRANTEDISVPAGVEYKIQNALYNLDKEKKERNTIHYRNNILSKVAFFFISILMVGSVAYAGTVAYQYFIQKTSKTSYFENERELFEINDQEINYKKISSYEEYLKYKEKLNNIIDMTQEDFKNNFLIVAIGSWRTPGIIIANISADDNTLYVEVGKKVTEEEIQKEEYMVSAMVSRDLDRENISVKNVVKEIKSDKYKRLEELPSDYNIQNAEKDGCIIVNHVKMKEEDKEKVDNFIVNTKNGNNDYIRIFRQENSGDIVIFDIQYRDGEYVVCTDQTRVFMGSKEIIHLGIFQNIEKEEYLEKDSFMYGYTRIYLNELTGSEVTVAIYK